MNDNVIQEFISAIQTPESDKDNIYSAIVSRVDNEGTVWVYVAGSDKETPTASSSAEVKSGDVVNVLWRDNKLYIAGNYSDPASGMARVRQVEQSANIAREAANNAVADAGRARTAAEEAEATAKGVEAIAVRAEETANSVRSIAQRAEESAGIAKTAADNAMLSLSSVQDVVGVLDWITNHGTMTSQAGETFDANNVYFIVDQNGDYVVGGTRYSLVTEPKAEDIDTYYCLSVDKSIQNYVATHIAVDSEGLWIIPDNGGNKVLIATGGAGKTYETAGTYIVGRVGSDDVVLAQFITDGARIGRDNETHVDIDYHSLQLIDRDQNKLFEVKDLRNQQGIATVKTSLVSDGSFRIGVDNVIEDVDSVSVNGVDLQISDYHVEDYQIIVIHEPYRPNIGDNVSIVYTTRSSISSLTFGSRLYDNEDAPFSSCFGNNNGAKGISSFAQGDGNQAIGACSHSEGRQTVAEGDYSHSQNHGTEAGYTAQTAIGKYNDNQSNNAFEIGNGTGDNNRSNAFEVDWNGNTTASGDITAVGDIEDGSGNVLANKLDASGIFDLIYPVGSYYWTSNGSFSPANTFGGTWEKIDAGVTLVSAGTGYTVQSGTAKDGGEETVKLTDQQMAHGHGFTNPTVNKHHHDSLASAGFVNGTGLTMTSKRAYTAANTSGVGYVVSGSATAISTSATTADATATTSGGAVANLYGASSTREAFDNMPPYKAAYCWHRTA